MKTYVAILLLVFANLANAQLILSEDNLTMISATFNGRSSGQIMEIFWRNEGLSNISTSHGPYIIFTEDKYSPVWIERFQVRIPSGASALATVKGYSLLPGKSTNRPGRKITNNKNWYAADLQQSLGPEHSLMGFPGVTYRNPDPSRELNLVYPGTDIFFPYQFDAYTNSTLFVRFLFEAERWISEAYPAHKRRGGVKTPLAFNPDMERDFIQQVSIWMVSALLTGIPFNDQILNDELIIKYAAGKEIKVKDVSSDIRRQIRQGIGQIWDTALELCINANVIQRGQIRRTEMARTELRDGYCFLDQAERFMYVEDESVCNSVRGTFFKTLTDAEDFLSLLHPKTVSLDQIQPYFSLQNSLGFSGKLYGHWSPLNKIQYVFGSTSVFEGTVNPGTGEFALPQVPLQPGNNNFRIEANYPGIGTIALAEGGVNLSTTRERLRTGQQKTVHGLELMLNEITRAGICRISVGGESLSLALNQPVALENAQINIEYVDSRSSEIRIAVSSRQCGFEAAQDRYSGGLGISCAMDELSGGLIQGLNYADLQLSNTFGYQQPGVQIGLISQFNINTTYLDCGAFHLRRLDRELADPLNRFIKEAFDSAAVDRNSRNKEISLLEIDPYGRRLLLASERLESAGNIDLGLLRPTRKLANPDYILDGAIFIECCRAAADDPCGLVPVNIRFEAYLIDAVTGRMMTTYGTRSSAIDHERIMQCYDLLTEEGKSQARETMRFFAVNALKHFMDYLSQNY